MTGLKSWWLPVVVAGYLAVALAVLTQLDVWAGVDALLLSTPDSRQYASVGSALTAGTALDHPRVLAIRPYVFPLMLSLHRWLGATRYVLIQLALNAVTITLVFLSVRRFSASVIAATIAVALLVANPTFTVVAAHGLSESLGFMLVALVVYLIVLSELEPGEHKAYRVLLALAVAMCVRPVLMPFLLLWLAFLLLSPRQSGSVRRISWLVVALLPVVLQIILVGLATGRPGFSRVGAHGVETRFFPAVYGFASGEGFVNYRSETAETARREYPTAGDRFGFMASHPGASVRAYSHLLAMNLFSRSTLVPGGEGGVASSLRLVSGHLNRMWIGFHLAAIVVVGVMLICGIRGRRMRFLVLCALLVWSVLLASALTYWQGDRIIMLVAPAWCVLYVATAEQLIYVFRQNRERGGSV